MKKPKDILYPIYVYTQRTNRIGVVEIDNPDRSCLEKAKLECTFFADNGEDALSMANSWVKSSAAMPPGIDTYMVMTALAVREYVYSEKDAVSNLILEKYKKQINEESNEND